MQAVRHLAAPFVTGAAFLAMVAAAPGVRDLVRPAATRAAGPVAGVPAAAGFVLIANAENPATKITKLDATRIFLKKARAWPGGGPSADPVDQRDASPVRKEFLAAVIGKDASAMNAYWQSQLFVGRTTPPPVKGSDADVIAFVAAAKGGIGYVSAGVALPATVKAISVSE
jgi:ABC-type phosphate transport system substrate-binding protein